MATLPTFVLCLQDTDTPSKETRIPTAIKVLRKHNDFANQVRIDCCITGIRARLVFTPGITGTALDKLLSKGAGLHYRAQRGFYAAFVDLESVPKTYDRVCCMHRTVRVLRRRTWSCDFDGYLCDRCFTVCQFLVSLQLINHRPTGHGRNRPTAG